MELRLPIDVAQAISSLHPTAEFTTSNGKVTNWFSKSITQPTESEITAEQTRLTDLYNSQEYQRKRATSYPSLADQLDMQYWDKKNGTTTWVDAIAKVKSDNPKP